MTRPQGLTRLLGPLIALAAAAAPARAAEYQVDVAAAPGGDGSASRPRIGIQQGLDALAAPGDTLVVHAGTCDVPRRSRSATCKAATPDRS